MEPALKLEEYLKQISPPNKALMEAAREREARLAKPQGSLGRL